MFVTRPAMEGNGVDANWWSAAGAVFTEESSPVFGSTPRDVALRRGKFIQYRCPLSNCHRRCMSLPGRDVEQLPLSSRALTQSDRYGTLTHTLSVPFFSIKHASQGRGRPCCFSPIFGFAHPLKPRAGFPQLSLSRLPWRRTLNACVSGGGGGAAPGAPGFRVLVWGYRFKGLGGVDTVTFPEKEQDDFRMYRPRSRAHQFRAPGDPARRQSTSGKSHWGCGPPRRRRQRGGAALRGLRGARTFPGAPSAHDITAASLCLVRRYRYHHVSNRQHWTGGQGPRPHDVRR